VSRTSRPHRLVAAVAAAPLLAGMSACGAGLDAQTYQERTAADAANTSVGFLDVRNLRVEPPLVGSTLRQGGTAVVEMTIVSQDNQPDRLVEATSPVASEVVTVVDGEPGEIVVPALGSTVNSARLRLVGLTKDLNSGQNIAVALRFARAGTVREVIPVGLTGESDRPIFTEGDGEGQPALQGPAGGHGEKAQTEP